MKITITYPKNKPVKDKLIFCRKDIWNLDHNLAVILGQSIKYFYDSTSENSGIPYLDTKDTGIDPKLNKQFFNSIEPITEDPIFTKFAITMAWFGILHEMAEGFLLYSKGFKFDNQNKNNSVMTNKKARAEYLNFVKSKNEKLDRSLYLFKKYFTVLWD